MRIRGSFKKRMTILSFRTKFIIIQLNDHLQMMLSLLSVDNDEVIILNPTTPPLDGGYEKRSAGNKPHRKKLVLIVSYYNTFTSLFNIIITDKIPD